MDAVAKAPWMGSGRSSYFSGKQSGLLKEAVVEAHVKPSAAWMLLRRLHRWVYAVFLMGATPSQNINARHKKGALMSAFF